MKKPVFTGAGCAIVTPFKGRDNSEVNFEKLGELIEFQIAGGTDAIVICGTTGIIVNTIATAIAMMITCFITFMGILLFL